MFRAVLLDAVTEADLKAVARSLVARAKAGEVPAIRELLDRLIGKVGDREPEDQGPPVIQVVPNVPRRAEGEAVGHASEFTGRRVINVVTGLPDD